MWIHMTVILKCYKCTSLWGELGFKSFLLQWCNFKKILFIPILFFFNFAYIYRETNTHTLRECDNFGHVDTYNCSDWDPVQYLGYCTVCNCSNLNHSLNLMLQISTHHLSHVSDPCAPFNFTLLSIFQNFSLSLSLSFHQTYLGQPWPNFHGCSLQPPNPILPPPPVVYAGVASSL